MTVQTIDALALAAASTRRRFVFGLLPAAAAAGLGIAAIAPQPAAADSRSTKNRKGRKTRRPDRLPGGGTGTVTPPAPVRPEASILAGYDLDNGHGTLTVSGANFRANEQVTLKVKMDWIPSLGCYLVEFTTSVTADAFGGFDWANSGYCPRKVDVWASQGVDISTHVSFEDYTCPW